MNTRSFIRSLRTIVVLLCLGSSSTAFSQTIDGHRVVCLGASRTTLTCATAGGTWSSANPARATIDPTSGVVTGVSTGTATISYELPSSSFITAVVTVNFQVMNPIGFSAGSASRCTGGATATCTISPKFGNEWTSSDASIATINTGGLVTPSATNAGTTTISYRHGTANCYVTREVTVNATPTVTATTTMCNGTTQTVTATPSGGTWSSSNTSVGTVHSTTGIMSALAGGGTTIYHTGTTGCLTSRYITVLGLPGAITGATNICEGNTSALSSSTSGGTWSSSNTSVATIGTSGVVSALAAGTTMITYTVGSGCTRTIVVTVNAGLPTNTGLLTVCMGQTATLSNATGGGTWSSSAPSVATVVTGSGLVTGIAAGTANISYRVGAGCYSISVVTVNTALAAISGSSNVCAGASTTLTHAVSGGTWSVSNANATIGSTSGILTGVTAGAAVVTYAISSGCYKTMSVIIMAEPAAIAGTLTVCPGTSTTLSSATGGGTWSSSNTSVATVSGSGVVTGVSGGTTTISYTNSSGCNTTAIVTVSSGGGSIDGSATLYPGLTSTLTASASGGTWSSSNTSVATVGSSSGVVSAVAAGTATITYAIGSCTPATIIVTVLSTPAPITGGLGLEVGDGDTLTNPVTGGLWSSSNTSVATIGSTSGVLTAISVGTSAISYTIGSTYAASIIVTVSSTIAPAGCGRSWVSLSSNPDINPNLDASFFDMNLDECGVPYMALGYYSTTPALVPHNHIRVLKFVNGHFEQLGPIMDSTSTEHISVAAAPDGTAYLAYIDYTDGFNLVVKKYDGADWVTVGGSPITTAGCDLGSIRIDHAGVPYLGYGDWASGPTVKKFNGTTWELVGAAGFAPTGSGLAGMELDDSGHIYVSYVIATSEEFVNRMGVMKYNGSAWVELGDSVTRYYNMGWGSHLAVSGDGTPCVSWFGEWGSSVYRFNGTAWDSIGTPIGTPFYDLFAGNDGQPMLSYDNGYDVRTIRYDGSNWVPFGSAMPDFGGVGVRAAMSPSGEQYVACVPYSGGSAFVLRLDGSQAQFVPGAQGIQGGGSYSWISFMVPPHAELAFGPEGERYVAYSEHGKPAVRKLSNGYWVPLDSDNPGAPAHISSDEVYGYFDMTNDSAGNIYIAIPAYTPTTGVLVKKFDGTTWSAVGSVFGEMLDGDEANIDIEISNSGFPYVAYGSGYPADLIRVWQFDGTSWTGSSIAAQAAKMSLGINGSDVPYVFYSDWLSDRAGFVKWYDGSSWVTLGGGSCTPDSSDYNDIAIAPDGTPFIIYTDGTNGNKATVAKFVSGSWTAVGSGVVSPGASTSTSIVISSTGEPYVSFIDGTSNNKVTVKMFDGSSWVDVGGATISSQDFTGARVVLDGDDVPYVSGQQLTSYYNATVVMKYASGNELSGNLSVCTGQTTTLHAFGEGNWISSNPSVATVNCIGIVRGVAAGTASITYTNDTCDAVVVVTVNASPSAGTITGASVVAYGGSTTLTPSVPGGVWSCTPSSVATVTSGGVVSGLSDGIAVIRYTVTSGGCSAYASHAVTVAFMKPAVSGNAEAASAFSVYPNPSSGVFNLRSGVAGKVTVFTMDGRVVMESKVEAGTSGISMPSGSAAGVYLLRFAGNDGSAQVIRLVYQP